MQPQNYELQKLSNSLFKAILMFNTIKSQIPFQPILHCAEKMAESKTQVFLEVMAS